MPTYIKRLIEEGEHQMLDFKFEVSDFSKIARTLVAFANTDGGRLLIGVKDNGSIAGVRSEEEYFMLEGAASLYCKPEVSFSIKEWQVEGKKVLEAIIGPGREKPYMAKDSDGKWVAYIRQDDRNFRASSIQLKVWEQRRRGKGTLVRYREAEKALLTWFKKHQKITPHKFRQIAGITGLQAERTLVSFIMLGIIQLEYTESEMFITLTDNYAARLSMK
ncbi:MAG: ATP-binding protein [Bacteroidales bacterium]|nr:ATP-binding protein [Bacteroidales bacterium]